MIEHDVRAQLDELLARVAGGDRGAFSALYDQMAGRVLWLIRSKLIDHAQSEEVAQEVFLEVWQNASRFDPARGTASGWILMMASRRAIDRIRSSQKSRTRDYDTGIRDYQTAHDDVWETVSVSFEHERAERAMAVLSRIQREAVELTYLRGLNSREVSELLGVPVGTVKTRVRDGLMALRRAMLVEDRQLVSS